MKNRMQILAPLFAVLALLNGGASPAQASGTVYVDNKAIKTCPLSVSTIQLGIDSLDPHFGGTVIVCPGTYFEHISISGYTNLKLIGKGTPTAAVIIEPPPPYPLTVPTAMIDVASSTNVTIQGFLINGLLTMAPDSASAGIRFTNSSGTITRNSIEYVGSGTTSVLADVNDPAMNGIDVEGTAPGPVKVIQNTLIGNQHHGILLRGVSGVQVIKNLILVDVNVTQKSGITLSNASDNKISGNTIRTYSFWFNGYHEWYGIEIFESNGNSVTANTVTDAPYGVLVWAECEDIAHGTANSNVIKSNKIIDSIFGVRLEAFPIDGVSQCNPHVDGNLVSGNTLTSNRGQFTQGVTFKAVVSTAPVFTGHVDNNSVISNTFTGYQSSAVYATGSGSTSGNIVSRNKFVVQAPPGA